MADLCDLPVEVVDADEAAATGACVQAASVLGGVEASEVATRWGLGVGHAVDRGESAATAGDVRGHYAELRARLHPLG